MQKIGNDECVLVPKKRNGVANAVIPKPLIDMILKTININGIDIDLYDGPIGISLSGGADSSILAYIIAKYSDSPIKILTFASHLKHRKNAFHALKVVDKLLEIFPNKDIEHRIIFKQEQTRDSLIDFLKDSIRIFDLETLYMSTTKIPDDETLKGFVNVVSDSIYKNRSSDSNRQLYNGKFYNPFRNVDKRAIYEIYTFYGLLDTLYPLTRSCSSIENIDHHCGKCWWCEERLWAFGKLI